jgi:hypothetical protein
MFIELQFADDAGGRLLVNSQRISYVQLSAGKTLVTFDNGPRLTCTAEAFYLLNGKSPTPVMSPAPLGWVRLIVVRNATGHFEFNADPVLALTLEDGVAKPICLDEPFDDDVAVYYGAPDGSVISPGDAVWATREVALAAITARAEESVA